MRDQPPQVFTGQGRYTNEHTFVIHAADTIPPATDCLVHLQRKKTRLLAIESESEDMVV